MGLTSYLSDLNKDFRSGLNSAIGASTGTSAADQLDMLVKMNQPTKYGWSWNQLANQLQYEQYVKELSASLQKSSAANLNYNIALNKALPSAMRAGLESAGYNPILGVLGSYNAQTGSVSSSVGSQGLGNLPQVSRGGSSAFSAAAVNKAIDMFAGKLNAEVENVKTDTDNKKVSNEDIKASANLKNAEAENIRARTETENVMREPHRQDAVLKSRYGDGFTGAVGRYMETAVESGKNTVDSISDYFKRKFGGQNSSSSAKSVDAPINNHGSSARDEDVKSSVTSRVLNRVPALRTRIGRALRRALEIYGGRGVSK